MKISRFALDSRGLARVLGELEARILEVVWTLGQATVKDVAAALGPEAHVKTVMTVMNRMVEKGVLHREARGRSFVYSAVLDRERFAQQVASRVLSGLLADFGKPTLAHFVQEIPPEQLAELERLIAERRRLQGGE
ncbi:Transcriptional repressor CopY [bacterium HR26]|nr:Transcriptional repressor CopY [bacterium HR26]